jgi:hypothetical protein
VGSILGGTRAVDTIFTKKFGRSRLKVAVLNPDIIPSFVDVVIGDFVYELQFKVENDIIDGEPSVIDMDSTMEEYKDPEESEGPKNMDHDGDKDEGNKTEIIEKNSSSELVPPKEAPNKSCDGGVNTKHSKSGQVEVVTAGHSTKPVVLLSPTGINSDGSAHWKASILQNKNDSGTILKEKGLGKGTMSPSQSRKRTAATSAQDSPEKAKAAKARKNMDHSPPKGNDTQTFSFNSFDNSFLLQSASALGVSFGSNEREVASSLQEFKDRESARLSDDKLPDITCLDADDLSSVCSLDDRIDLEALNFICSEISEVLGDGGCDSKCLHTPVSHSKKSASKSGKKSNKSSKK